MHTSIIIDNSKKFTKIEDVLENLDVIFELASTDVLKILKKTFKNTINQTEFLDAYLFATKNLKNNLKNKKYLDGIRRFYSCKSVKNSVQLIVQKLVSETRNMLKKGYKNSTVDLKKQYKKEIIENYNINKTYNIEKEIELEEMQKFDKKVIKKGLKKVWESSKFDTDFDLQDLKDLCNKYKIDLYSIVTKEELEAPEMGTFELKNGAKQTFLIFDEE